MAGLLTRFSMLSIVAVFAAAATGGELDPPIGPVSPTMKPLDLVEARTALTPGTTPGNASNVFIITQPGSYYLIDNLLENQGENGILVLASDVQIDLNGFRIRGGNTGAAKGILVSSGAIEGIRVINGRIENFASTAIDLGPRAVVEDVIITDCGGGIEVGQQSRVRSCSVTQCSGTGISVGDDSLIADSLSNNNTIGVSCGNDTVVKGTVMSGNSTGVNAASRCAFDGCSITQNSFAMFADNETTMRGCTVGANNAGCELNGPNSHIVDCQFNDTAAGFAVFAGDGSLVDGCSFTENGGNAVQAGSFMSVTNSTFRGNGTGVSLFDGCVVQNNRFLNNTRAVFVPNGLADNTVDSNTFISNTTALDIDGDDNLVTRNFFARNASTLAVSGTGNSLGNLNGTPGNAAPYDNLLY